MNKLFEIATRISTPLMLAGIIAFVFLIIVRQIIKRNIFPMLTKQLSGEIIKLIIHYLFILTLVATLLGFAGYIFSSARQVSATEQTTENKSAINDMPVAKAKAPKPIGVKGLTNTHIAVHTGDNISITAQGTISVGPNAGVSGPDGKELRIMSILIKRYNIVPDYMHAALMFKLQKDDNWIECGSDYNFTANEDGELIFQINDNDQGNNSGKYIVNVEKTN